jgi:hypothetical protein
VRAAEHRLAIAEALGRRSLAPRIHLGRVRRAEMAMNPLTPRSCGGPTRLFLDVGAHGRADEITPRFVDDAFRPRGPYASNRVDHAGVAGQHHETRLGPRERH